MMKLGKKTYQSKKMTKKIKTTIKRMRIKSNKKKIKGEIQKKINFKNHLILHKQQLKEQGLNLMNEKIE